MDQRDFHVFDIDDRFNEVNIVHINLLSNLN